jgi:hypothetical protein
MPTRTQARPILALAVLALVAAGCGGSSAQPPYDPYSGTPPKGTPIGVTDGTDILDSGGVATGWKWIAFDDAFCTDATLVGSDYQFTTSTTGLAVSWTPTASADVVFFLQGGGACWDFITCGGAKAYGIDKTATTGPFGPAEFAANVYEAYPNAWVHRANLPPALADATIVFVPYCTGDVHAGDRTTTYVAPPLLAGLPSITWRHSGHANLMAFLKRLGATFPAPGKLVVAGSSAGGFGALANYPAFRWYWPSATSYLVDDSGPPLIGDAIPSSTRAAWYASWNMGASLDAFCTGCRTDMSQGLVELAQRFPQDRIALLSHLQDATIRDFFGTYTLSPPSFNPMDATTFETQLRLLGTSVMAPTAKERWFFTSSPTPTYHPTLDDPIQVTTPDPGLAPWLEQMLSDDAAWASVSDP